MENEMKRKIWLTSDNHFNHANIIRYCNRPFSSVDEMDDFMISKWNEKVSKEDIVIHLGDFALAGEDKIKKLRSKLNGTIILIKGNHDWRVKENYGFIIVKGILQINNFLLTHKPLPAEEIPQGFVNIHGHVHQKESLTGINVSVEKTDYEPIELENILKKQFQNMKGG